jgi:hypothetical protein
MAMRAAASSILLFALGLAWPQAASLQGRVLDSRYSQPLAGAKVVLVSAHPAPVRLDSLVTAADGKYRFDSLQPAADSGTAYMLYVYKDAYNDFEGRPSILDTLAVLRLRPGEDRTFDAKLSKRIALTIAVKTGTGAPLAGANVLLLHYRWAEPRTARTGPDGNAVFADVGPYSYQATAAFPGRETVSLPFIIPGSSFADSQSISLDSDAGLAYDRSIAGGVRRHSDSGAPHAGAGVHFECAVGNGVTVILFDTSAADGSFTIRGVPDRCNDGLLSGSFRDTVRVTFAGNELVRRQDLILDPTIHTALRPRSFRAAGKPAMASGRAWLFPLRGDPDRTINLQGRRQSRRSGMADGK